jgi:hypothetical protein
MDILVQTTISGDEITTITKGATISIDAYDVVDETTVASSASDYEVALSPGTETLIKIAVFWLDAYEEKTPGTPDCTFKVHAAIGDAIDFDGPVVWIRSQDDFFGELDLVFLANLGDSDRKFSAFIGRTIA